jgi:hypothetical protein
MGLGGGPAEICPESPRCVTGLLGTGGDASCGSFMDKVQFIFDSSSCGGRTSVQDGCTGYWVLRCVNKAESNIKKEREQRSAITLVVPGV